MNKTFITILLIALVGTAMCAETETDKGFDEVVTCIESGSKLVTEVTEYIKAKNWWDGPALGRIVTALNKTFTDCKAAFSKDKMLQAPVDLAAYTTTCQSSVRAVKAAIDAMKNEISWRGWGKFTDKFNAFKGQINYARSVCK